MTTLALGQRHRRRPVAGSPPSTALQHRSGKAASSAAKNPLQEFESLLLSLDSDLRGILQAWPASASPASRQVGGGGGGGGRKAGGGRGTSASPLRRPRGLPHGSDAKGGHTPDGAAVVDLQAALTRPEPLDAGDLTWLNLELPRRSSVSPQRAAAAAAGSPARGGRDPARLRTAAALAAAAGAGGGGGGGAAGSAPHASARRGGGAHTHASAAPGSALGHRRIASAAVRTTSAPAAKVAWPQPQSQPHPTPVSAAEQNQRRSSATSAVTRSHSWSYAERRDRFKALKAGAAGPEASPPAHTSEHPKEKGGFWHPGRAPPTSARTERRQHPAAAPGGVSQRVPPPPKLKEIPLLSARAEKATHRRQSRESERPQQLTSLDEARKQRRLQREALSTPSVMKKLVKLEHARQWGGTESHRARAGARTPMFHSSPKSGSKGYLTFKK